MATAEEVDFTRFRVVTGQGILAVFDADEEWDGRDEPLSQLAYWHDLASEQLFFFDQRLFTLDDVLQSIATMPRDLNIELADILTERPDLAPLPEINTPGLWIPAIESDVLNVMAGGVPAAPPEGEVSGQANPCVPIDCGAAMSMTGPIPAPVRGTPTAGLFSMAQAGASCNCGGGNPPQPPSDPCTPPQPGRCCNTLCSTCQSNECDSDGIPNASDPDVDGDGILNGQDNDVDGDGILNKYDCDIDGDGLSDWEDSDADGDSFPNAEDIDSDGDGIVSWGDPKRNGCEGPCDNSNVYCCGISDPCLCSDPCHSSCNIDCDDGYGCTNDYCYASNGKPQCSSSCPIGFAESGGSVASGCDLPFNVEIREITFLNTHDVYRNYPLPSGWEVGQKYTGPNWEYTGNPVHPTFYTKKTKMRMRVKLYVTAGTDDEPGSQPWTVQGPDGIAGSGTSFGINCGRHYSELNFTMSTPLPDEVRAYEPMTLTWKFKKPQSDDWITRITTHYVYVSFASPIPTIVTYLDNLPTLRRVSNVCRWANGEATQDGIALKIYQELSKDSVTTFQLVDPPDCPNPWSMLPNGGCTGGDCNDLAFLMKYTCGVIGLSASVGYVYATTDNSNFSLSPFDPEVMILGGLEYALSYEGGGGCNKWQAVCKVNNRYYAPHVTYNTDSIALIKSEICPNTLDFRHQCWSSGPDPVTNRCTCHPSQNPVPLPGPPPGGCP